MKRTLFLIAISILFFSFINRQDEPLRHPLEKHLKNIRQLTFGGENAEAYFSFDETKLFFNQRVTALNAIKSI
jgi:TolB protein